MIEPIEMTEVEQTAVNCDGGDSALGHPRIYLHIKPEVGHIECPYCGLQYVIKSKSAASEDSG